MSAQKSGTNRVRSGWRAAKTLRQLGLALVCSGVVTLGAQAGGHVSSHSTAAVYDGVESAQVQAVGYRGYKRSLRHSSRGFSSRRYSKYGHSGLGFSKLGRSGKKYRSDYYVHDSLRSSPRYKGYKGFSNRSRFDQRRFRTYRY